MNNHKKVVPELFSGGQMTELFLAGKSPLRRAQTHTLRVLFIYFLFFSGNGFGMPGGASNNINAGRDASLGSIDAIDETSSHESGESAPATSPAMHPLDPTALGVDWQSFLEQVHSVERVAAPFVESRSFAFRKEPKMYRGVFRKEADGRVSLAYIEPEPIFLHIGEGFAYYKKDKGRARRIPRANSQSDSLELFLKLLNFDLVGLAENYDISGHIKNEVWSLGFITKIDSDEGLPYQSMQVEGSGTAVERIELRKGKKQQIVIEMGDPVYPNFYLPGIKARYFFLPETDE